MRVSQLTAGEAEARSDELICLLEDAVASGASIGFLPPLRMGEAAAYWRIALEAVREGARAIVVAEEDGRIVGSAQLAYEARQNGSHRAEVMKVMVLQSARRRGVGRALMQGLERLAREAGRSLLVLDTRSGDAAEQLYRELGYTAAGVIPEYARSASGELDDSVFMYRRIE